jgi:predicted AAA+ superfamily ATPase
MVEAASPLTANPRHEDRESASADYLDILCTGSYPEPMQRAGRRRNAWFDNYLQRIVSRDARDVSRLAHLDRLPTLVRLLAGLAPEGTKAQVRGTANNAPALRHPARI